MGAFGCDSYIRINNPTEFGMAVTRQIPGVAAGAEGLCLYQENKIVECDVGYIEISQFADPRDPLQLDQQRIDRFINAGLGHLPFFLKHKTFAHQVEYRLIWMVTAGVGDYLDLKVPEAVRFCARPNLVTE
jgi:hypothetical protein